MPQRSAAVRFLRFVAGTSDSARDLHSRVAAIRFTVLATLLYATMMLPPLNLHASFAPLFRSFGNALFAKSFLGHEQASVHFFDASSEDLFDQVNRAYVNDLPRSIESRLPRAQREKDTLLFLQGKDASTMGFLRASARLMAFTPAAILLAIVLATPSSIRRRLALGLGSFVLLSGFIGFRLSILASHGGFANTAKPYHLYEPSAFWQDVLNRIHTIVCSNPSVNYVAPVIIWAVVAVALSMIAHVLTARREQRAP